MGGAGLSLGTIDRIQPVSLAIAQRLPLLEPLHSLLPSGLQRGSTAGVAGAGATSLACALLAGPMQAGSWAAVVGVPTLGLVAAENLGVPLHQLVMVDQPERRRWGTVVAALVDAFELVLIGPVRPSARDARRIEARSRERGAVVVSLGNRWPAAVDVALTVEGCWEGLGQGHGVLQGRRVTVTATGRRGSTRPRVSELWLPDATGAVAVVKHPRLELVPEPRRLAR